MHTFLYTNAQCLMDHKKYFYIEMAHMFCRKSNLLTIFLFLKDGFHSRNLLSKQSFVFPSCSFKAPIFKASFIKMIVLYVGNLVTISLKVKCLRKVYTDCPINCVTSTFTRVFYSFSPHLATKNAILEL